MPRLLSTQSLLWLLLYVPLAIQTYRYLGGVSFYGEYLHWTGEQATRLLIVALAVTPLRLTFPEALWVRWLMTRRRDIGVASCVYALLHTVAYLDYHDTLQAIIEDSVTLGMLTGWVAMIIFVLLATTSNDHAVRLLRGRWKALHRTVYVAAALTFAHWLLTAFDPTAGAVHLSVWVLLLLLRIFQTWRTRSA